MSKPASGSIFETDFFKAVDLSKMMSDFKIPGINFDSLFAIQRKNVEAMTALNQAAFDNMQTIAHRQAEIVRQACEDAVRITNSIMSASSPQDKVQIQTEASKAAVEKCMNNAREMSEALSRYNTQAMETLSTRMRESMEELRNCVSSSQDRNAA